MNKKLLSTVAGALTAAYLYFKFERSNVMEKMIPVINDVVDVCNQAAQPRSSSKVDQDYKKIEAEKLREMVRAMDADQQKVILECIPMEFIFKRIISEYTSLQEFKTNIQSAMHLVG